MTSDSRDRPTIFLSNAANFFIKDRYIMSRHVNVTFSLLLSRKVFQTSAKNTNVRSL